MGIGGRTCSTLPQDRRPFITLYPIRHYLGVYDRSEFMNQGWRCATPRVEKYRRALFPRFIQGVTNFNDQAVPTRPGKETLDKR